MQVELIYSDFFLYSLFLHYPDSRFSGLFTQVPTSPVFSFTLNVAYFSPIQIAIKWLPLLDLKLYFEGQIAQARFK